MCEKNVKNIRLSVHVCMQKRYLFVCVHICEEVFMLIHVIFGWCLYVDVYVRVDMFVCVYICSYVNVQFVCFFVFCLFVC